jgi:hypothetical protein
MGTKVTMVRMVPNKAGITRFLLRSGAAKVTLVELPVLLAKGALAVPNKSGLARLTLRRRAGRVLPGALALAISAAAAGAAAGYLVKEGGKALPNLSLFDGAV